MLGFLIGAACLMGFIKMARQGRRWSGQGFAPWGAHDAFHGSPSGYDCGHHCGHERNHDDSRDGYGHARRGPPRWRRGLGRNAFLRAIFERLDTSPGQEKAIRAALEELRVVAKSVKDEIKGTRGEIARAIRGEHMNDGTLAEVSARLTAASEAMRRAGEGALVKVHESLDEKQRALLADFIESGPGFHVGRHFGGFGGGPYRAGSV